MSTPPKPTPAFAVVMVVLILGAVGAASYYQLVYVPGLPTTTTTGQLSCTPSTCGNVTIPAGAVSCSPAPCGYDPSLITVYLGQNSTVYWRNADDAPHTVTASSFGSPNMPAGAVYHYKFTVAGNYSYVCSYHAWMRASVQVKP